MDKQNHIAKEYNHPEFAEVIQLIRTTRNRVLHVANSALIDLYWQLGEFISNKLSTAQWGDGVVEQLAIHIEQNAPDLKGFSKKNLWRMKQFYETYAPKAQFVSALLRQISWTNNLLIITRCHTEEERAFYLQKTIDEHFSSRELDRQISSALYERTMLNKPKVSAVMRQTNPAAEQLFRDQYILEFIGTQGDHLENSFRLSLIQQMKKVILELGKDFIFIDQEYRLQVGNSDFRIDMLFYHRELQCLVAFELKNEAFKPEHLGQLNFYLEALDRDVKKPQENPSIGVLLCKDKDDEVVEYALSRCLSPTMVAEYKLCLPDKQLLQQKMREIFESAHEDTSLK